jgi:hypothetical protein
MSYVLFSLYTETRLCQRGRCGRDRMVFGFYSYLCNQCQSPLTLWVRFQLRRGVLDTTLGDKVCKWLAIGRWFSPSTPVSSTNKADCHDITEVLLKVALNTITLTLRISYLVLELFSPFFINIEFYGNMWYTIPSSRKFELF